MYVDNRFEVVYHRVVFLLHPSLSTLKGIEALMHEITVAHRTFLMDLLTYYSNAGLKK